MAKICRFTILIMSFFISCGIFPKESFRDVDLSPPEYIGQEAAGTEEILISFNEPCFPDEEGFTCEGLTVKDILAEDSTLRLIFNEVQQPGKKYSARLSVRDKDNNKLVFMFEFYGYNPEVPFMLINEFNPRGSGNNPDCVEFYIISGGLLGGVMFCIGSKDNPDYNYIFPNIRVDGGDYIILHCKPEGLEEEIDETEEKGISGGKLTYGEAYDLWWGEAPGLPGNNGVLTLYDSPTGQLSDAVLYSNRINDPDDTYFGWTSTVFSAVQDIADEQGWTFSSLIPLPEETVYCENSTATRSICRNSSSQDCNSKEDWHVVPTGGRSFGYRNTDEIYK